MDGPVALSVRGVDKSYKKRQVLANVSFDVRRGEALAIVGENGAGKTTLLRICAGVLPADRGEVARVPGVAYCPQEFGLIEHLTAAEHVRYVGAGLGLDRTGQPVAAMPCFSGFAFPTATRRPYASCPAGLDKSSTSRWLS